MRWDGDAIGWYWNIAYEEKLYCASLELYGWHGIMYWSCMVSRSLDFGVIAIIYIKEKNEYLDTGQVCKRCNPSPGNV